ncbi:hypothetical protein C8035_v001470 [Colletotrichum spinosum]|uniref:Uncharacterized protein n=1 Tax=Colletotrichum spinosum TaxID=1347390 RepID=A0A4R8PZT1_9PEZI|nr:hypothetical protein C8035_v001470 [Colletotrichum spinosum]
MNRTIRSFVLQCTTSFLLLLSLHVFLADASPTARTAEATDETLFKRARAKYPLFASTYDGRVEKGQYLLELLPVGNEEAATRNGGASIISPFQNPDDVARWGWRTRLTWYPWAASSDGGDILLPGYGTRLEDAFADKAYPIKEEEIGVYHSVHNETFQTSWLRFGWQTKQPSEGSYKNVANPYSGAFIFDVNYSPTHEIAKAKELKKKKPETKVGDVPDLDTLSDIAYFQWTDACAYKGKSPKDLKVIFRSGIEYKPTFDIAIEALKEKNHKRVPGWNERAVFPMTSRQGQAILGSTHGSGTAWMLIQHKDGLGVKTITEVAVWGSGGGFEFTKGPKGVALNMRFTIKDA